MRKKIGLWILSLFVILAAASQAVYAQDIISNRIGTIRITMPDGSVITAAKEEHLPDIPSGAIIEILDGSIDIAPTDGFIQVVAGNSAATVKAGDSLRVSFNLKAAASGFKASLGEINIIIGNTTITVKAGQEILASLDATNGEVYIKSIAGVIETVTAGVKAEVFKGASAKISADAVIRDVHIESVFGKTRVTPIEGKVIVLAKAESIDTAGSIVGEIQTFAPETVSEEAVDLVFIVEEEPVEPEKPEGSPFVP